MRYEASSVVFHAVLVALLAGCDTHPCRVERSGSLSVPPGAACPTDPHAVAAELERQPDTEDVTVQSLSDESHQPALTLCWYRLAASAYPCRSTDERSALLAEAEAFRSDVTDANDGIVACDAEGYIYGKVLPAPQTAEDPDGRVPLDPVNCPSQVATSGQVLDAFLGADQYPARVVCTYETIQTSVCGNGSAPFGPN